MNLYVQRCSLYGSFDASSNGAIFMWASEMASVFSLLASFDTLRDQVELQSHPVEELPMCVVFAKDLRSCAYTINVLSDNFIGALRSVLGGTSTSFFIGKRVRGGAIIVFAGSFDR